MNSSLGLVSNMEATLVVSRAGEVESVPPSTLRCLLISEYPSFLSVEALSSPVFNRTIPESSAPEVETEEGKAGVYS